MEENIEEVSFDALIDELKDELRNNLLNDESLVPDEWWEDILENFNNEYSSKGMQVDISTLEFDIYRNTLSYEGNIDLNNEFILSFFNETVRKWEADEWFDSFPTVCKNYELSDDELEIYRDNIHDSLDEMIFDNVELITSNSEVALPISIKDTLETAYKKIKNEYPDEATTLNSWIGKLIAAELFFQDEIMVDETEYDDFMANLSYEIEKKIANETDDIIYSINSELEKMYYALKDSLHNTYESYYGVEYLDSILRDRVYEVILDSAGNQLEIVDLDGI